MDLKIAIGVCYGRSGSFFLHSLLDGHPQIMSLPPYMMNLAQQISDTLEMTNEAFLEQFVNDFKNLFARNLEDCASNKYVNVNNNMARTQTGLLRLNVDSFKEKLLHFLADSNHSFKSRFIGVHLAVYELLGIPTANKEVIFFQLHTPNYVLMRLLREEMGHLWVCHSVRDPIATFVRMCVAHNNDAKSTENYQVDQIRNQMESCFRHFLYAGCDLIDDTNSDSLAIKLEQLHENPKGSLSAVCQFLEVDWDDILLIETVNHGQNWEGIIGDTTGFDLEKTLANNAKYRNSISEFDLIRLEKIARQRLIKWQYPLYFEHVKSALDFEAPYDFELLPYIDNDTIKQNIKSAYDAKIKGNRGDLHRAILKTINYMPEQSAPYSPIADIK
ncbi:sulfotransferase [Pseudoalteromonas piscicida]|uniref:Sulfotransferase n=1 Tax=Pseudoalteromonas piscicida TaxID=43662 RepID=A0A2A5JVA4_PSEO7|nr:sulfotransferase [Pseudoalteromonas piscicida]PCK33413.1 hypothetical protein CEX98_02645 [Pseudoalteromonas piscicida]